MSGKLRHCTANATLLLHVCKGYWVIEGRDTSWPVIRWWTGNSSKVISGRNEGWQQHIETWKPDSLILRLGEGNNAWAMTPLWRLHIGSKVKLCDWLVFIWHQNGDTNRLIWLFSISEWEHFTSSSSPKSIFCPLACCGSSYFFRIAGVFPFS